MEDIYLKIFELAKPYYQKGRAYNIPHVSWMMGEADKIADIEHLDKKILLPVVILHDVGYSVIKDTNPNIKDKETKKLHMAEGAKISESILREINYSPVLTEKIVRYISVHDAWLFGDDSPFQECEEMAVFNDLDFLWVTSSFNAFEATAKSMQKTPQQFYEFWIKDEKLTRRPFYCEYTKKLWETSINKIKQLLESRSV
ncbi:MAG: HD domain-containing protein [Patescibacteria group bacterium]